MKTRNDASCGRNENRQKRREMSTGSFNNDNSIFLPFQKKMPSLLCLLLVTLSTAVKSDTEEDTMSSIYYASGSMRYLVLREEERSHAVERYCSKLNSTEPLNIDLEETPEGYLTSHEDYLSNWENANLTSDGIPMICKWRLVPQTARYNFMDNARYGDHKEIMDPSGDQMPVLLSFTFAGMDIPHEPDEMTNLHAHQPIPGFQCTASFVRFYIIDRELHRQVLAEFCGRGWMAGFDIPLLRGSVVLIHVKLLQPYRGFRIFYETVTKKPEIPRKVTSMTTTTTTTPSTSTATTPKLQVNENVTLVSVNMENGTSVLLGNDTTSSGGNYSSTESPKITQTDPTFVNMTANNNVGTIINSSESVPEFVERQEPMKPIVLHDEASYIDIEMVSSGFETAAVAENNQQACFTPGGLVLTSLSGKIHYRQQTNTSVWCRWVIRPLLDSPSQRVKYFKFRIPEFAVDESWNPCDTNTLEMVFFNQDNTSRTDNYCQLKLPQPKKWQKIDPLDGIELIFRSTSLSGLVTAGFEFEFYVVLESQVFYADLQQCGRSRMKPPALNSKQHFTNPPHVHHQHQSPVARSRSNSRFPNKNNSNSNSPILHRSKRVIGGDIARAGSWPWIVMLSFFGYPLCAASILNERWLLTAAHCFKNERKSVVGWEVLIGKHTSDTEGDLGWDYKTKIIRPPVELILTHYRYGRSRNPKEFDIALVKVEQPIPFTKLASPVCPPSVKLTGSETCYVLGFGETNDTLTAGYLNEAQIPVISNDDCRLLNPYYSQYVTESMLCAGYTTGGVDNCRGDNGGPLVCYVSSRWELHGVISWGKGCAKKDAPGVYTRVSSYLHWIQKVINTYK